MAAPGSDRSPGLSNPSRTGSWLPFALAGIVVSGLALGIDPLLGRPFLFGSRAGLSLLLAALVLFAGALLRPGRLQRLASGFCCSFLGFVIALGSAEILFRAAGHDFLSWEERKKLIPPFFRLPDEPFAEGLFKRRGPDRWSGQVLRERVRQLGIVPDPYADEEPITVTYDADGFRNPDGLVDWDVVVAGDSFTELGYLPYEALSTSVLARELGLRVKNLGVCATSTLSQLAFLERFGVAKSTRHAFVVFFEGNDLLELHKEFAVVDGWRATGTSSVVRPGPNTSLIRFLAKKLPQFVWRGSVDVMDAVFVGSSGDVPLTVMQAPPDPDSMPGEWKAELQEALDRYVALARGHGLEPWLAYVPCKLHVHRERLRFNDRAEPNVKRWKPNDLPGFVTALCAARGIGCVDTTPGLRAEAEASGGLLYNTIYDTHLNARGAEIVGKELARALRED